MKSKLRIATLAISTALIVCMSSGCGISVNKDTNNLKTVTVWSGSSHSKDVYTQYINKWNETTGKEKGIKIDYQVKEGDSLGKTVELALQSCNAPDFFPSVELAKGVENNWLLAIEDLPGGKQFLEPYNEQGLLVEWYQYNGKTYILPSGSQTTGLIYNKDMFIAAGIVDEDGNAKPPETFAELREDAKILTKPDKREYGIIVPMKWSGWFISDVITMNRASFGHDHFNPTTGKFEFQTLKPIYEMYLGLRDDGSIYPGAYNIDNDPARALFAEGSIGMKFGFSFDVGVLNDQFPAKIDWGVAPCPVADKNKKYKQRLNTSTSFAMNAASLTTVGGEKMLEVLKFFVSDETEKYMYKEGVELPLKKENVEKVKIQNPKKGWTDFANLVSISEPRQLITPKVDIAGLKNLQALFLEDVWTGKITVDEAIEILNKRYNEGMIKYRDLHQYEPSKYTIPNWDEKTKR